MNQEKAKEFFSAYYEGTIDPGLRQSVEHRLRSSRELSEEYALFERTMEELDALKFERVEVPDDLHERISARIDLHLYEQKRSDRSAWGQWLRSLALVGVGAAAIVGTVLTLRDGPSLGAGTAQILPGPTSGVQVVLRPTEDGAMLEYQPAGAKRLTIRSGLEGDVLRTIDLAGEPVRSPLVNRNREAATISIHEDGQKTPAVVALPGTRPNLSAEGEGTLEDLAKALAGFYRVPVVIQVADPAQPVAWKFSGVSAREAASQALDSPRFSVEERKTGTVWILDK